jgi:hypothetical protein
VVVIGEMEDEVNTLYQPFEKGYEDIHIAPPSSTGATYRVRERESGIPCILIWISKKDEFTSSIVAHECCHAALEIWCYIKSEVSLSNQEPFCYLLGNLVRLAVGCFYEIPGIQPPVISKDTFENPTKIKKVKQPKHKEVLSK